MTEVDRPVLSTSTSKRNGGRTEGIRPNCAKRTIICKVQSLTLITHFKDRMSSAFKRPSKKLLPPTIKPESKHSVHPIIRIDEMASSQLPVDHQLPRRRMRSWRQAGRSPPRVDVGVGGAGRRRSGEKRSQTDSHGIEEISEMTNNAPTDKQLDCNAGYHHHTDPCKED